MNIFCRSKRKMPRENNNFWINMSNNSSELLLSHWNDKRWFTHSYSNLIRPLLKELLPIFISNISSKRLSTLRLQIGFTQYFVCLLVAILKFVNATGLFYKGLKSFFLKRWRMCEEGGSTNVFVSKISLNLDVYWFSHECCIKNQYFLRLILFLWVEKIKWLVSNWFIESFTFLIF